MFRRIRNLWLRSKALSVLQTAYDLPLKFPLQDAEDALLREAVEETSASRGNIYDAAASFMLLRIKAEQDRDVAAKYFAKFAVGYTRTSSLIAHKSSHMKRFRELTEDR